MAQPLRGEGRSPPPPFSWARLKATSKPRLALYLVVLFGLFQSLSMSIESLRMMIESRRFDEHAGTGRVVVTGGCGSIGKPLVQRLLRTRTPVTVLDTLCHSDEIEGAYNTPYNYYGIPSLDSPDIHIGDIRNATALSSVLTHDIVGVIHLAAVSRVSWCLDNEPDCRDVNERGAQLVLDALTLLNKRDGGKRWFIYPSSTDVYGASTTNTPAKEDSVASLLSGALPLLSILRLSAERLIEQHVQSSPNLHAIVLRLSTIYGSIHDHQDRLVPSIATQALSHQVVQLASEDPDNTASEVRELSIDLLHIDDCVEAFLLAIERLTRSFRKWAPLTTRNPFEVYNIASGKLLPVSRLLEIILKASQSNSPVQYIKLDNRYHNGTNVDVSKARKTLGFRSTPFEMDVESGLIRMIEEYRWRTHDFLISKIEKTCGGNSRTSSDAAATDLDKLDGCSVHVDVDIQGEFVSLSPPDKLGQHVWTASLEILLDPLRTTTSRSTDGSKTLLKLRSKDGFVFGVSGPQKGPIMLAKVLDHEASSHEGFMDEWEMDFSGEESATRLVIPGTHTHLVPPTFLGGNFSLATIHSQSAWPFRVTPICCPAPTPWPFMADDPIEYTIEYQRTSLSRPFHASPAKTVCGRMEKALAKLQADMSAGVELELQEKAPRRSSRPTDWASAELPACSNICEHPTICVDTGDCQCVVSSCVPRQGFPFSSTAHSSVISFPPPSPSINTSLSEVVEALHWMDVLRPDAARFIHQGIPFPRIRVAPLSPDDQHALSNYGAAKLDIGDLQDLNCMSADAQLERSVARMHAPNDTAADMVFIPHYQGRGDGRLNNTFAYAMQAVEGFDASKVIIPFTHDWGQCLKFQWNVWDMRKEVGLKLNPLVRSTTAWSVMGDLNSICYRPHQDVIIPPRTCLSPQLFEAFTDVSNVRPARNRRVLATFKGTHWGTGALYRFKTECRRSGWNSAHTDRRLHPDGPELRSLWGTTGEYDYMGLLNDTIFCPQPAGTTGWATRLVDSIYAGCIPVLIGHASHYPFFDILDWGKLSVRVEPLDLSRLEDILLSRYTLPDIERLQTNLMVVRNAFVYPLDDWTPERSQRHMIDERGPLFFALHSTRMRMITKWPQDRSFDLP